MWAEQSVIIDREPVAANNGTERTVDKENSLRNVQDIINTIIRLG